MRPNLFASLAAFLVLGGATRASNGRQTRAPTASHTERVQPNDNRRAAGTLRGGVLALRLIARVAEWHPDGEDAPGAPMMAFAEESGPALIPGPLVRVPAGTEAAVRVRNTLPDTLRVYGLHARPFRDSAALAPLVLAPGEARDVRFRLDAPGTYLYWGTTMRRPIAFRTREDAQLSGAIVVDSAGARPRDRIFVIGEWSDTVSRVGIQQQRLLTVINGLSWPHTERVAYTVGDTVRWRLINASADLHPMHLHGFFFRVVSRGDGTTDSTYTSQNGVPGDLAVTESMLTPATVSLVWVPERAGNWLFHCHIPDHFAPRGPLGTEPVVGAHEAGDHARRGMNGLVLGVTVRPAPNATVASQEAPSATRERHLRLLVRANVGSTAATPFFGYAVHEGGAEPPPDTGLVGAPTLDLVRGQPVRITVVNRLPEPTGVHWHGIELESYYDGVPGFSGVGDRVTPMIAPNDSFEVRFTPPRAGTFIYHTHANELRQQQAGLAGALVVREPGTVRDPATDIPLVIMSPTEFELNRRVALLNGSPSPPPLAMTVGRTYRLRFIQMSATRAAATVELRRGNTLAVWRPIAKDGADLPARASTVQPARMFIAVGETGDFEFTPTEPGDLRLEVHFGGAIGPTPGGPLRIPAGGRLPPLVIAATLPIHVTAPAPPRRTHLVLLGTGMPNPDPDRWGPAIAIVVDSTVYIVDAGVGVTRRVAAAARQTKLAAFAMPKLSIAFLTHLHSDHTLGLPDLMLTPWLFNRTVPLEVYGPPGTQKMVEHLQAAYAEDIDMHLHSGEPANTTGYVTHAHDVPPGVVYRDSLVKVTAFAVAHGKWAHAYGYRFDTPDRSIVVSGDTSPSDAVAAACDGCDVLVHEVIAESNIVARTPAWQAYMRAYHTPGPDLGRIAAKAKPKLLVLYHEVPIGFDEAELLGEIRRAFKGSVVAGRDLGVY